MSSTIKRNSSPAPQANGAAAGGVGEIEVVIDGARVWLQELVHEVVVAQPGLELEVGDLVLLARTEAPAPESGLLVCVMRVPPVLGVCPTEALVARPLL